MNQITEFLINDGGVQREILILILFLPIIATLVSIARYYIGIKTFSLYVPLLLSTAFYLIKVTHDGDSTEKILAGIGFGVLFTIIVLGSTALVSRIIKGVRMHYFPKISLTISVVSIIFVAVVTILAYIEVLSLNDMNFTSIILIMLVSERFVTTLSKKKFLTSVKLSVETILLSLSCYLLIVIEPLSNLLLNHPEIVLLTIPISYFIGKYTGLRITEYMRFQDILGEEENKE